MVSELKRVSAWISYYFKKNLLLKWFHLEGEGKGMSLIHAAVSLFLV